jgi:hypothetical protein
MPGMMQIAMGVMLGCLASNIISWIIVAFIQKGL